MTRSMAGRAGRRAVGRDPRATAGERTDDADRGSATVVGAVLAMVLVTVSLAVLHLASAVIARHRAAAAADLAALAGAGAAVAGRAAPCVEAAAIAQAGAGRLDSCTVDGWEVRVIVSAAAGPLGQRATARARAGPDIATG